MKNKDNRLIPWEIQVFAMRNIVSKTDEHASAKACNAWIRKKRKKFCYEIMDLFESLNKPTDINILERVSFLQNEISDLMDEYFKQNRTPLV
jgi:hypothetical protein